MLNVDRLVLEDILRVYQRALGQTRTGIAAEHKMDGEH